MNTGKMSGKRHGYTIATTEEETARSEAIVELALEYKDASTRRILEFLCKFGETALRHDCTKKDAISKLLTALTTVVGSKTKDKIERELLRGKPKLVEGTTQTINGVQFVRVKHSAVTFSPELTVEEEVGSWQTASSYTRKVPEDDYDKQFFTPGTPLREVAKVTRDLTASKLLLFGSEVVEVVEGDSSEDEEEPSESEEEEADIRASRSGARRGPRPAAKKKKAKKEET